LFEERKRRDELGSAPSGMRSPIIIPRNKHDPNQTRYLFLFRGFTQALERREQKTLARSRRTCRTMELGLPSPCSKRKASTQGVVRWVARERLNVPQLSLLGSSSPVTISVVLREDERTSTGTSRNVAAALCELEMKRTVGRGVGLLVAPQMAGAPRYKSGKGPTFHQHAVKLTCLKQCLETRVRQLVTFLAGSWICSVEFLGASRNLQCQSSPPGKLDPQAVI